MDKRLRRILPRVQKPARYTGGEYNQIIKDKAQVDLRMALVFPDTYEIGMSNLGIRILYGAINEMPGVWCERCFAPWGDMEDEMRRASIPLWALESGDPLTAFDAIGFSLGYEMAYTNVLNMLDLAGIPLRSAERSSLTPLVFAGGTSCVNPEPMADFLDFCFIGEGEEMDKELLTLLRQAKNQNWSKQDFLSEAAKIEGIYVPSLYEPIYNDDGTLKELKALEGAPEFVKRRIVTDFDTAYFPTKPIVPSTEIVHDRVTLELFRGCIRGCRFCQAGFVYRPVRSRDKDRLVEQGIESLESTGYQEITLSSLSTSDYRPLSGLCDGLLDFCVPHSIGLSLPSLRADNFSLDLMSKVQQVRKSGLTFAPEAGTQRLRDAINKNVLEEDLLNTCKIAFEGGWNNIKLYFMLGLPTETDEDVLAISELAMKVLWLWKSHASNKARGVNITVSTSCFVPKPHTPFQWEAQVDMEEYRRRVKLLRENMRAKAISYNWHDADTSLIEAVLSRGDRRVGAVIEEVWKTGGKLDSWTEYFSFERWIKAFENCGIDPKFYACRERTSDEVLPWSRVDIGVKPEFLWSEREKCYRAELSPDCRNKCTNCGALSMMNGGRCDG
ncbi:MAG: B12-binding domain-containing radical SAM protein [Firmicutes bacterium HGW-Firmicutes-16]|nr:MAG: B12-binding domain-containing radical SAM protein [Firmicutes bacterium HGW-Firmicutes-16]